MLSVRSLVPCKYARDLTVSPADIDFLALNNTHVEISARVYSNSQNARDVRVFFYEDLDGDGTLAPEEEIGNDTVENIVADSFGMASVEWNAHNSIERKLHNIYIWVNQHNDTNELNTANNLVQRGMQDPRADLELTFYGFLDEQPIGHFVIRLCRTISCELAGKDTIARQLENDLGITFGETTPDGKFTLQWASCIGMCDQGPALLVNDRVYTRVTPDMVHIILEECRSTFGLHAVLKEQEHLV